MRALFSTVGSRDDVQPVVALALPVATPCTTALAALIQKGSARDEPTTVMFWAQNPERKKVLATTMCYGFVNI